MSMSEDEWKLESHFAREAKRRQVCQCGGDMPGRCPGPDVCPMVAQEEDEDAQPWSWEC